MAKFTVTLPLVLTVKIEAATAADAIADATGWAKWIDPHQEQFEDYASDHATGIDGDAIGWGGGLTVAENLPATATLS